MALKASSIFREQIDLSDNFKIKNKLFSGRYGIIIPLYIYPSDIFNNKFFNNLMYLGKKYPNADVIAILDPEQGAGSVVDGNYVYAIKRLKSAGIIIAGYIYTHWGDRDINEAKADIDKWIELYPDIDGIFFDEMSNDDNDDHIAYYKELTEYVKYNKNLLFTIGNPGTSLSLKYFEENTCDIIVTWESNVMMDESFYADDWMDGLINVPKEQRAALLYNQNKDVPSEVIGTGNGSNKSFSYKTKYIPVVHNSVKVTYTIGGSTYTANDVPLIDSNTVNIQGDHIDSATIDLETGEINITFTNAPDDGKDITIEYATLTEYIDNMNLLMKYHKWFFITHDGYNDTNPWDNYSFYMEDLFKFGEKLSYPAEIEVVSDTNRAVVNSKNQITAWVNFDGTDGTIRDSYNVSSVTRDDRGQYTIYFEQEMNNTNYAVAGFSEENDGLDTGSSYQASVGFKRTSEIKTTSCGIMNANVNGNNTADGKYITVIFVGGK